MPKIIKKYPTFVAGSGMLSQRSALKCEILDYAYGPAALPSSDKLTNGQTPWCFGRIWLQLCYRSTPSSYYMIKLYKSGAFIEACYIFFNEIIGLEYDITNEEPV